METNQPESKECFMRFKNDHDLLHCITECTHSTIKYQRDKIMTKIDLTNRDLSYTIQHLEQNSNSLPSWEKTDTLKTHCSSSQKHTQLSPKTLKRHQFYNVTTVKNTCSCQCSCPPLLLQYIVTFNFSFFLPKVNIYSTLVAAKNGVPTPLRYSCIAAIPYMGHNLYNLFVVICLAKPGANRLKVGHRE